jgi:hypothetical protein
MAVTAALGHIKLMKVCSGRPCSSVESSLLQPFQSSLASCCSWFDLREAFVVLIRKKHHVRTRHIKCEALDAYHLQVLVYSAGAGYVGDQQVARYAVSGS